MSASAVEGLLVRVLAAARLPELDAPTLSFLTSLVEEEVTFLQEAPGCMTGAQLLVLLSEKLESTFVDYELARTEDEGRALCAQIVHAMKESGMVQLADAAEGSSDSSSAGLLASPPPRLSAPVSISSVLSAKAEAAAADPVVTMASIQRASQRWTAEEERTLFQSLADSKKSHGDDAPEDEIVVQEGGCELCARDMPLTRHHLIPRYVHNKAPYCRMAKEHLNTCALICRPCHSAIHKFEDEKRLAANFHTIPLLLADERVQKWIKYISKRKVNRTQAENEAGANLRYGR